MGGKFQRENVERFQKAWIEGGGSPAKVADILGIDVSGVYCRRRLLAKQGIVLRTVSPGYNGGNNGLCRSDWKEKPPEYKDRIEMSLRDGYCVIFSDAHFWPVQYLRDQRPSLAHEGLLLILKELKPKIVVSNGDAFDGATISRHPPVNWQEPPTVEQELDATRRFMDEIVRITPKARHIFTVGNHDSRFDRRLASDARQFRGVKGFSLQDHLSEWEFCYGALVNQNTDPFFIIHAIRGGEYAPRNNVLAVGCTTYTGHLHSQKSIPVTTLLHEWDGVDGGMLADRDGPQFTYTSSRPTNWREGFAVQRVDEAGLRYPAELCRVLYHRKERRLVFRGEVICARKR